MCAVCDNPELAEAAGLDPCHCNAPYTLRAYARIEADLRRRSFIGGAGAALALFAGFGLAPRGASAQDSSQPLLLTNFRLFDGNETRLKDGVDILIEGDRVAALPRRGQGPTDARVIDCGGRAVVPGLIDTHVHMTLAGVSMIAALTGDPAFVHLVASRTAGSLLNQGFTTVRDVGGPAFALKQAIDRGVVPGPRIFPSGAALSQTAGHGDFRMLNEIPRMPTSPPNVVEAQGVNVIADGVPEVLRRTREQLMKGASQIKIMAGGGVASLYDPLDSIQYTLEEMKAAVQAASDWGTYVCAHVYTPTAIGRCLDAGVKCIEHGQLADADTVKRMADEGAWWSIQPFFADEDSNQYADPLQQAKQQEVAEGTVRAFELATRYPVKMSFGTDTLFNPAGIGRTGRQLNKFSRYLAPLDALRLATGAAGELLSMSGERAPYRGRLGVIEPGAFADLLVVDADPSISLDWLETPDTSLRLIMKGGAVVRENLS